MWKTSSDVQIPLHSIHALPSSITHINVNFSPCVESLNCNYHSEANKVFFFVCRDDYSSLQRIAKAVEKVTLDIRGRWGNCSTCPYRPLFSYTAHHIIISSSSLQLATFGRSNYYHDQNIFETVVHGTSRAYCARRFKYLQYLHSSTILNTQVEYVVLESRVTVAPSSKHKKTQNKQIQKYF